MTEYIVVVVEESIQYGGAGSLVYITRAANRNAALAAVRAHRYNNFPNRGQYCVVTSENVFTKKEYLQRVIDSAERVD